MVTPYVQFWRLMSSEVLVNVTLEFQDWWMNRRPKMESSAAPVIERHDSMIPNDSKKYCLFSGTR